MKTNILYAVILALSVIFPAGCASLSRPAGVTHEPDNGRPLIPSAAEAFRRGEYEMLRPHLSPEMRAQISREKFEAMLQELRSNGRIEAIEYLTELEHPLLPSELWKITMDKTGENNGTRIKTGILLRLIIASSADKPQIMGVMIQ